MTKKAEFVHDFLFLRSATTEGKAYGGFQWPLEAGGMVEPDDWNPEPVCGGGLHGLPEGFGNWGLVGMPSDPSIPWYVCGAKRDEAVVIDAEKIKVPRCVVLYVGSFAGAMAIIGPRMAPAVEAIIADRMKRTNTEGAASNSGHRGAASNSGYSGAASNSGHSGAASNSGHSGAASNSGDSGAASNSGDRGAASSIGQHGIAMTHGLKSRAMVTETNLLVLVERDPETGRILHHFAAMCGERGVKPGVWYALVGGELTEFK